MKEHRVGASPRLKARIAGVFYMLEATTAVFGQIFLLDMFVVPRDPTATATNILANEWLFELGFASSLIAVVFHTVWALLFYDLFKPVNRSVSLLALLVILVGYAIQAITCLFYIARLLVLRGAGPAFTAEQSQALAYMFLRLNTQAFNTYLVFFGFWCVLIGYLIYKSTFMPRIIGALLMIAGLGWTLHLLPTLARQMSPLIFTAAALGEIPLMLWLFVSGVNVQRWKEQAHAAVTF